MVMTCFECLIELKTLCRFTGTPEDKIPNPVSLLYFLLVYLIKEGKLLPTEECSKFFEAAQKIKIRTMLKIFRYMNDAGDVEVLSKRHIATELLLEAQDCGMVEEFKNKARNMTIEELRSMYKERLLK